MARAKTTEKPKASKAVKAAKKAAPKRAPKPEAVAPEAEAPEAEAEVAVELTPLQECSVDFDPTADPFRG